MAGPKVIVFGPTGSVGSVTALAAAERGARVVLAMRDTTKTIPGLDAATEKKRGFERVTADLSKPDTVRAAVAQTGATRAFFYLQHGSSDHMRGTIEAMKAGGIELPIFLSSFTVRGDVAAANPNDPITYVHSMVEFGLKEVFGAGNYAALRGGCFASNTLTWYKTDIDRRLFKIFGPDAGVDAISNKDIGDVAGCILAEGPKDDVRDIYLYGPTLMSHLDFIKTLVKESGMQAQIDVTKTADEAFKQFVEERKFPEPIVKSFVLGLSAKPDAGAHVFGLPIDPAHLQNVEKYTGHKPQTFKEWIHENKESLLA